MYYPTGAGQRQDSYIQQVVTREKDVEGALFPPGLHTIEPGGYVLQLKSDCASLHTRRPELQLSGQSSILQSACAFYAETIWQFNLYHNIRQIDPRTLSLSLAHSAQQSAKQAAGLFSGSLVKCASACSCRAAHARLTLARLHRAAAARSHPAVHPARDRQDARAHAGVQPRPAVRAASVRPHHHRDQPVRLRLTIN